MADCPDCHRPEWSGDGDMPSNDVACINRGGLVCAMIAAGYRRGLLAGVELAKRYAHIGGCVGVVRFIDWTETDAEAAKLTGDSDV